MSAATAAEAAEDKAFGREQERRGDAGRGLRNAMVIDPARNEQVNVAILAKAPIAGAAKTRLIPALGAEGAARLQRELISRTVATALAAGVGRVSLWCSPDRGHPFFQDIASRYPIQLYEQCAGDLGDRMHAVFVASHGFSPTLLIGVDCPSLAPTHLRRCAECLRRGVDAVCLPAEDGGYVLVGLRQPTARLFESIEWGGSTVMAVTRQRLLELKMIWSEPETLWDLDTPGDLPRWEALSGDTT